MCCTAKCCPLVTAWATTIHKFQGFEAGFDETDMFWRLIINPGSEKWEKDCPGAFYVSLSRAKTMGSRTSDTDFPKDSAIYWIGEGVNTNRIRQGAYKKRKKRSDPIRHCDAVIKRERWVQYLQRRKDLTTKRIYSKSELRDIKKKRFPQLELDERISNTATKPNETWKALKIEKYSMPKTYFGLYI